MSENSHHPDCPELSIEADECGLCPYLCAAQKRAWGDLEARARLAIDIAYRMGVSHGEASRMVTAASNAYAEGRKVALDEATAAVARATTLNRNKDSMTISSRAPRCTCGRQAPEG